MDVTPTDQRGGSGSHASKKYNINDGGNDDNYPLND